MMGLRSLGARVRLLRPPPPSPYLPARLGEGEPTRRRAEVRARRSRLLPKAGSARKAGRRTPKTEAGRRKDEAEQESTHEHRSDALRLNIDGPDEIGAEEQHSARFGKKELGPAGTRLPTSGSQGYNRSS